MKITREQKKIDSKSRIAQIYLGDYLAARVRSLSRKHNIGISELGRYAFQKLLDADDKGTLEVVEEK